MKQSGWRLAVALAACTLPGMAAAQSTCSRMQVVPLKNGLYNFQMNENDSSLEECATMNGAGFTITRANFSNATNGQAAAYTSIYRGCHWGACTASNPFPIEESRLVSATASVKVTQPSGYSNDAAYDIWFNKSPKASGQPNGAEVMIWLSHQGTIQPFGARVGTASINGVQYEVWTGNQSSWKIVSYVASRPVTAVENLNLLPFFADAVSRGSVAPSWWLIDVEFGFEIWTGGKGLAVSDFSVSAAAGQRSSAVSNVSSVPSNPSISSYPQEPSRASRTASSCHVGYSIGNQWPGGFQAAIAIENRGTAPWSDWTLTWAFANGQTITNLWNGTATQNGTIVTVRSKDYNRTVAAGGSYTGLGFTGTWNNAANIVPGSFAVNGTTCN